MLIYFIIHHIHDFSKESLGLLQDSMPKPLPQSYMQIPFRIPACLVNIKNHFSNPIYHILMFTQYEFINKALTFYMSLFPISLQEKLGGRVFESRVTRDYADFGRLINRTYYKKEDVANLKFYTS